MVVNLELANQDLLCYIADKTKFVTIHTFTLNVLEILKPADLTLKIRVGKPGCRFTFRKSRASRCKDFKVAVNKFPIIT